MGESPQDQELMVSSCLELPAWQLSLQVHFCLLWADSLTVFPYRKTRLREKIREPVTLLIVLVEIFWMWVSEP